MQLCTCAAVMQSLGTVEALYPSKISYCISSNATRHSGVGFHINKLITIATIFIKHIESNYFIFATCAFYFFHFYRAKIKMSVSMILVIYCYKCMCSFSLHIDLTLCTSFYLSFIFPYMIDCRFPVGSWFQNVTFHNT